MKRTLPTFTAVRVVVNTMHRMVYPFLDTFARGMGVSLEAMSIALTARAAAGALGPFLASIADSRGRRAGIIFGLLLFSAGTGIVLIWPVFPVFVLALILTTLGKYAVDPSMHAHLGDRVPYEQRGLAIAVVEMGWSLSFIVGVPAFGLLIKRFEWWAPFPILTLLSLFSAGVIFWLLPSERAAPVHKTSLLANFSVIFRSSSAVAGLLVGLLMSAANEMVNLVFGVWLGDEFGLDVAAIGFAALVIGISELSGESLVGGLADRLGKKRAVAGGLLLGSAAALALPLLGQSLVGAFVGLFIFYITFEFSLVTSISMMTELAPTARATLMAVNIAGQSVGRALAALVAARVFAGGIGASVLGAVALNLLALLALRRVVIRQET